MRGQARDRVRVVLDAELAAIELALRVAVLLAAGCQAADVKRRLGINERQLRAAHKRLRAALEG
jgi:DNA-binding CsgD family transcriptional regulator